MIALIVDRIFLIVDWIALIIALVVVGYAMDHTQDFIFIAVIFCPEIVRRAQLVTVEKDTVEEHHSHAIRRSSAKVQFHWS